MKYPLIAIALAIMGCTINHIEGNGNINNREDVGVETDVQAEGIPK
jgi:hypothetical protein